MPTVILCYLVVFQGNTDNLLVLEKQNHGKIFSTNQTPDEMNK